VGVQVKGHSDAGVAKHLAHDLGMHLFAEKQRRGGMAKVMEPDGARPTRVRRGRKPLILRLPLSIGPPVSFVKTRSKVSPFGPQPEAFLRLRPSMAFEHTVTVLNPRPSHRWPRRPRGSTDGKLESA
jgi:hypothetical protein